MMYKIDTKVGGEKVRIGIFKTSEDDAFRAGRKVLKTIENGEVRIERRKSYFEDWKWWITIARDKNRARTK